MVTATPPANRMQVVPFVDGKPEVALVEVELYCDFECPEFAPIVAGQDFPKYVEVREKDPRTGKPLPPARQRRRTRITRELFNHIQARIAEPLTVEAKSGTPIGGVWGYDSKHQKMTPIGQFLHIKEVGVADGAPVLPREMQEYYEKRDRIQARMNTLADRMFEIADEPDKAAERNAIVEEREKLRKDLQELPSPGSNGGKQNNGRKRGKD